MKSSIFNDAKPRTKPKRPAPVHANGSIKRSLAPPSSASTTPKKSWNLDELISAYQESGELPPILSPTLPKRDGEESISSLPLLSPTLPPIFTAVSPSKSPSKAATPRETSPAPTHKYRVKWISQMEAAKPRFLVRITFDPAYYRTRIKASSAASSATSSAASSGASMAKLKSPMKLQGLGITSSQSPAPSTQADPEAIANKNHWLGLARTAKTQCLEKESDDVRALVAGLDAVLMYIISHDIDERIRVATNGLPSERHWRALDADIKAVIQRLAKANPPHSSLAEFFNLFTKLLHTCRAVIQLRIHSVLRKVAASYNAKGTEQKVISVQSEALKAYDNFSDCLVAAKPASIYSLVPSRLPQTFRRKQTSLEKPPSESRVDPKDRIRPSKASFYLPIGPYSTLSEMAGLLYSATNEFIEIFNNNSGKRMEYTLNAN
ncbi:hypothetical protein DIURU_000060 [Diutina rugosa]|uniref:Ell binding protein Ebp1 C-terminal domain-containing protein n=1 Tax=Diutina rugosa TaxID=5481 RepID=A0A642V1H0_DIURU|nr:uncharacterized protein DIURU_000060 [Diutina rugosa]KAA8908747.1 hypothetical protein DIURU_000060 [Diutina rugosa]